MLLQLLNARNLTNIGAAAAQTACNRLTNLSPGSVTLALLEASSSIALWLQALVVQVWQGTRLATSTGTDVDSFLADFTLTREPGQRVIPSGTR